MLYFFDTYYSNNKASTSCVGINDWRTNELTILTNDVLDTNVDYKSGSFYKRELPCIKSILKKITLKQNDILIIDGFVYLDDNRTNGLGGYLYDYLNQIYPVIGVAKKDYIGIDKLKGKLYRGTSKKPLYITCAGLKLNTAISFISSMHGEYRIPSILRKVDQNCRQFSTNF